MRDWNKLGKAKPEEPPEEPSAIVARVYEELRAKAETEGGVEWPYDVKVPEGYDIGGRGDYAALKRAFEAEGLTVDSPYLGRGFTITPK